MASSDGCYDFDAPMHYFDFNSAHDEPDDSYFGKYGRPYFLFLFFYLVISFFLYYIG